jgi:Fur family zinc uptake transcriptional regulator
MGIMAAPIGSASKPRRAEISRALDRAEALCRQQGVRLTKLRRAVLELVLGSEHPVGAYDLLARLDDRVGAKAPATIYRALDFLLAQRCIHKIESLNAFVACVDVGDPHDSQFMICTDCGNAVEMHDAAIARILRRQSAKQGFALSGQIIELRGRCTGCQSKQAHA